MNQPRDEDLSQVSPSDEVQKPLLELLEKLLPMRMGGGICLLLFFFLI